MWLKERSLLFSIFITFKNLVPHVEVKVCFKSTDKMRWEQSDLVYSLHIKYQFTIVKIKNGNKNDFQKPSDTFHCACVLHERNTRVVWSRKIAPELRHKIAGRTVTCNKIDQFKSQTWTSIQKNHFHKVFVWWLKIEPLTKIKLSVRWSSRFPKLWTLLTVTVERV